VSALSVPDGLTSAESAAQMAAKPRKTRNTTNLSFTGLPNPVIGLLVAV
jgi:hypothetical protein